MSNLSYMQKQIVRRTEEIAAKTSGLKVITSAIDMNLVELTRGANIAWLQDQQRETKHRKEVN
jgi:hypothetical protein